MGIRYYGYAMVRQYGYPMVWVSDIIVAGFMFLLFTKQNFFIHQMFQQLVQLLSSMAGWSVASYFKPAILGFVYHCQGGQECNHHAFSYLKGDNHPYPRFDNSLWV